MNITKENVDALNAVVKVDITAEDYKTKVEDILKDYRKKPTSLDLGKVMYLWEW